MRLTQKPFTNDFIDTLRLSRRLFPHLENHRLNTLAKYFGLTTPVHKALEDCATTLELYQTISKHVAHNNVNLTARDKRRHVKLKSSSIVATTTEFDESHHLFEKVCMFTGTLEKMPRRRILRYD